MNVFNELFCQESASLWSFAQSVSPLEFTSTFLVQAPLEFSRMLKNFSVLIHPARALFLASSATEIWDACSFYKSLHKVYTQKF